MLVYQRVTHWNGLVSPNNSPAGSEGSYIEKRNLPGHIVDGCEILHHQSRMVKTLYINGQTTYQLVQDFATIHSMYIYKIIYIFKFIFISFHIHLDKVNQPHCGGTGMMISVGYFYQKLRWSTMMFLGKTTGKLANHVWGIWNMMPWVSTRIHLYTFKSPKPWLSIS